MKTVSVTALQRQLYGNRMIDPGESFECEEQYVLALELNEMIRRNAQEVSEKKSARKNYERRDMRADA